MSNLTNAIELIRDHDTNVYLTVFNNSSEDTDEKGLYEKWLNKIRTCLGNCTFGNDYCVLLLCTTSLFLEPIRIDSTETIIQIIQDLFKQPESLRIEVTTHHMTTHTWIFILSSELI